MHVIGNLTFLEYICTVIRPLGFINAEHYWVKYTIPHYIRCQHAVISNMATLPWIHSAHPLKGPAPVGMPAVRMRCFDGPAADTARESADSVDLQYFVSTI